MTERTLRHMAKEICGEFYESDRRSARFRALHPDQNRYVKDYWPHFYDLARKMATTMLTLPGVSQHLKDAIYEALLEDKEKAARPGGALMIPQTTLDVKDWEDVKLIDANPQLPISKQGAM